MSQTSIHDPTTQRQPHEDIDAATSDAGSDAPDTEAERELAERLAQIIEEANEKVVPLCRMIRKVRLLLLLPVFPSSFIDSLHLIIYLAHREL
jgi:hypothetical protein